MHLVNLPYTARKKYPAKFFKTASQGLRRLTRKSAITTAADNGAINVWYGDDRLWHGVISRHFCHIAEVESPTKSKLLDWIQRALVTIC